MNPTILETIENMLGINEKKHDYAPKYDGISWQPAPAKKGDPVKIFYRGVLKDHGANEVFLHYGLDSWNGIKTIRMEKTDDGFFANVNEKARHEINFCFKDSDGHWDNNKGYDWIIYLK